MVSKPRARSQAAAASRRASATTWSLLGLEEAEEADLVVVDLVVEPVADRRDPADDRAVPLGEEVLGLGVLEEGILRAIEQQRDVPTQRRDPAGGPARAADRGGR